MGNTFTTKELSKDGKYESITHYDSDKDDYILKDGYDISYLLNILDLKKQERDEEDKTTGDWFVSKDLIILPGTRKIDENGDLKIKVLFKFSDCFNNEIIFRLKPINGYKRLAVPVNTLQKIKDGTFVDKLSKEREDEIKNLYDEYLQYLNKET